MIRQINKHFNLKTIIKHQKGILFTKRFSTLLPHRIDTYNCAHIQLDKQPLTSTQQFAKKFDSTYNHMKKENISAIWIKISRKHSNFIPILIQQQKYSFDFHHPLRDGQGIVLSKWINQSTPSKLPSFCTHYIGVGGLIFNDNNQILLIKQKFAYKEGEKIHWKLPGGLVDPKQRMTDAVVREIQEELNLKTEAVGLIGARELLNFRFGSPDIYFMYLCKLKSGVEKVDKDEVAAFKWFKISEVMKSSFEKMHTFGQLMKGCEKVLEGVEEERVFETLEKHTFKVNQSLERKNLTFLSL